MRSPSNLGRHPPPNGRPQARGPAGPPHFRLSSRGPPWTAAAAPVTTDTRADRPYVFGGLGERHGVPLCELGPLRGVVAVPMLEGQGLLLIILRGSILCKCLPRASVPPKAGITPRAGINV
jgi:hypothetical protein